ncbi:MAG TPA: thiamine-phosphate kinase [Terrimicrobiaceae bacterium]
MKLSDLSEDRLLEILLADLPLGRNVLVGPGDDCAVVQGLGKRSMLLLKTDCILEGVHYLPEDEPRRVGWKALCRPVSDVAAMGGEPLHALVTVFSPKDRLVAYWKSLYKGLSKAAKHFGIGIVGGETSRSHYAGISVSLVGRVETRRLIQRSGGQPKDLLFVTGTLGGSRGKRHLDFVPRVVEARWLSSHRYVHAMMDLSDGLAADLPRLARASKCSFRIDPSALPKTRGCNNLQAMSDGEDYELLVAVAPRLGERLRRRWRETFPSLPLTCIGELTAPSATSTTLPPAFDHFFGCQKLPAGTS